MTPIENLLDQFEQTDNPVTRSSLRDIILDRLFKVYHCIKLTPAYFVLIDGFSNIEQSTLFLDWLKQHGLREYEVWLQNNHTSPQLSNRKEIIKETDYGHMVTLKMKEE